MTSIKGMAESTHQTGLCFFGPGVSLEGSIAACSNHGAHIS